MIELLLENENVTTFSHWLFSQNFPIIDVYQGFKYTSDFSGKIIFLSAYLGLPLCY